MTQEEKQLLLKDICARLPYGVIVRNEEEHEGHLNSINQTIFGIELGVNITATRRVDFQLDTCKPYLRPMSSMTEEEKEEILRELFGEASNLFYIDEEGIIDGKPTDFSRQGYNSVLFCPRNINTYIDWLNSHHFDYRGLIEKGLAFEAKDGMYETQ